MPGTQIAALIAAAAFLLLVGVLIVPILKLRRTVDAATRALTEIADQTGPLLTGAHATLDGVNTAVGKLHTTLDGVNAELARLDTITGHAEQVSGTVAQLSTIVAGATRSPLVKAAAFGYGVKSGINGHRPNGGRVTQERRRARKSGVVAGLVRRLVANRASAGERKGNV